MSGGKAKSKGEGSPPQDEGGGEWGSPNPRPLDAGDGRYSRHACREY